MIRLILLALTVSLLGCDRNAPTVVNSPPSETVEIVPPIQSQAEPDRIPESEDYNAIAFREANRAASAALEYNWSTANRILSRIDASRITDTDVEFYVDYSARTASVAERLGVDNRSNPDSIYNTVENLDFAALVATMASVYEREGFTGGARLIADAKKVRDEMDMWHTANRKLISRYGLD